MLIDDAMCRTLRGTILEPIKKGTLWQGFGVTYKSKTGLDLLEKIATIAKELLVIAWDELARFFRIKKHKVSKQKTKEALKMIKLLYGKENLEE